MADNWQPRATAPKDGKPIRVRRENCTPYGRAFWSESEQRWVTSVLFIGKEGCSAAFTHWQPMPSDEPPAVKDGE